MLHLAARRALLQPVDAFVPELCTVFFDPSDLSTMFEERTGASATTPSSVNGVVGSWRNKGTLGGWVSAAADAARPLLRQSGHVYWLEFDGVDDKLENATFFPTGNPGVVTLGLWFNASAGNAIIVCRRDGSGSQWNVFTNFNSWNGATFDGPSVSGTQNCVAVWRYDARECLIRRDGVNLTKASGIGVLTTGVLYVGGRHDTGEKFPAGKIGSIIVDHSKFSEPKTVELERFLQRVGGY